MEYLKLWNSLDGSESMKKIVSSILVISIFSCVLLSFASCIIVNDMEDYFDAWVPQPDSNVAIVDARDGTLLVENRVIDFYEKLEGTISPKPIKSVKFFLLDKNRLYGLSYDLNNQEYEEVITVYCFDLETGNAEIIYNEKIIPRELNVLSHGVTYQSTHFTEFYYSSRTLTICNALNTTLVNIDTLEVEVLSEPDASALPKYKIEPLRDENSKLQGYIISDSDIETVINLEYMAQHHPYIESLVNLGDHENLIFPDQSPTESFWGGALVVNDKIYLLCRVLDKDGESNSVIFSYDVVSDEFEFIHHKYTFDTPLEYVIAYE